MGIFRNRFGLVGLNLVAAGLLFACSGAETDDAANSNDALTGSLSNARTCAVKDGYTSAQLAAFATVGATTLPSSVSSNGATAIAKFNVSGVGDVFVVERGSEIDFYDINGIQVARATGPDGQLAWFGSNGTQADCGGTAAPPPVVNNNEDAGAAATCLSAAPIDATQYPYSKSAVAAVKCTAQEATAIDTYYQAHGGDADFTVTAWKAAVSSGCASCVFSTVDSAWWAPIVADGDQISAIDQGGCVASVSHNEACGKAYQQYQNCTVDACLVSCQTQEQFTACRQDASVLTGACKNAVDAVTTACGSTANLQAYETQCRGTTYTFDGPIRQLCVAPQ